MSERKDRIEKISRMSMEREPKERASFINEACGDDTEMKDSVNARVAQYERAREYFSGLARRMGIEGLADPKFTVIEGQTFGKYRIEQQIGEGGMGIVYRAIDTQLNRPVALKFLSPRHVDDENAQIRFSREARATANLNHRNILTLYEVLEYNGLAVIVMEHVDGETLRDKLKRGPLSVDTWFDYAAQLADGLDAAHREGIVHRDLKPANVMVSSEGIVKILDFGLAKLREASVLTRTGATLGTIAYMSPEQARGEEVDHRSDIWSLGVILYEMLFGKLPYKGSRDQAIIYGILNTQPEFSEASNTKRAEHCVQVITRTLAKDADERFQSAGELKRAIQEPPLTQTFKYRLRFAAAQRSVYLLLILAVLILIAGLWIQRPWQKEPTFVNYYSVAVLPAESTSSDPEEVYIANDITDALTKELSKMRSLKVIAPSFGEPFMESIKSPEEIGEDLSADAVIRMSLFSLGNDLQMTIRLFDSASGRLLLSNRFIRSPDKILSLQSEIAHSIFQALPVPQAANQQADSTRGRIVDLEAYRWYTRGKYFLDRSEEMTPGSGQYFFKADSALSRAIELDANNADALGLMSRIQLEYSTRSSRLKPEVREYAERALALDPGQPDALMSLARFSIFSSWNWNTAERLCLHAIDINPNNASLHRGLSMLYFQTNRDSLGLVQMRRAYELDPLSHWTLVVWTSELIKMGHYNEAIEAANELIALDSTIADPYGRRGKAAFLAGNDSLALDSFARYTALANDVGIVMSVNYRDMGKDEIFRKKYNEIIDSGNPLFLHYLHLALGDKEKTLYWLERDLEENPFFHVNLLDWDYERLLGNEPRFRAMLRKANLEQFLDE